MFKIEKMIREHEVKNGKTMDPLHVTALAYLYEVVHQERYEEAPQILQTAREMGVQEELIYGVLGGRTLTSARAA